ncbi:helix-turn-helix domain-containing protein [Halomonas sp. KO116]|uniref:helix-turn-helix domain-containing protein n=1 Tax=Halomonas sp. KO116 TaxID=1504981 RepID=UPI0009E41908
MWNLLSVQVTKFHLSSRLFFGGITLAAGIDRSYIGRVERGEVNITVEKLYEIAAVLQCEPASLLPTQTTL